MRFPNAFASIEEAASSCVRVASTLLPSVEGVAAYREAYDRYVRLYDATRAIGTS